MKGGRASRAGASKAIVDLAPVVSGLSQQVTLYEDGAVEYRGEKHVPRGTRWRTVAPVEVERLARG